MNNIDRLRMKKYLAIPKVVIALSRVINFTIYYPIMLNIKSRSKPHISCLTLAQTNFPLFIQNRNNHQAVASDSNIHVVSMEKEMQPVSITKTDVLNSASLAESAPILNKIC